MRTALTGDNGGYLFAFLPPADYQLRFDDEGFTPIEKRFHLSLAEAARMDVELQPAVVSETITVESSHAASAKLELLPVNRDIASTVLLSSNATDIGPHNGIIVAGAPSWDTLYLVDGAPIGEYQTGQPQDVVIEDAVEDISFQTSAIPAEYGRFTGGVVSTLTKSGGNEYRGSLRDMLTNSVWTASTPWTGQPAPGDHVNQKIEVRKGDQFATHTSKDRPGVTFEYTDDKPLLIDTKLAVSEPGDIVDGPVNERQVEPGRLSRSETQAPRRLESARQECHEVHELRVRPPVLESFRHDAQFQRSLLLNLILFERMRLALRIAQRQRRFAFADPHSGQLLPVLQADR